MNFFNYYAAWDSDTSATEREGVHSTAAEELLFFPLFSSSCLPLFNSPNLSVQMKQQKVRVWSN